MRKGNVIPLHAMKTYRGSGDIAPRILSLEWSISLCACIVPRKGPHDTLNRRLGWPQRLSGIFGQEKNLLSLLVFEPRTVQPVA